ncbi:MAG TPA: bifunctional pyr operon transcriptional regulator/uracil phosphoribosyltransferase PyrR [Flavobacteriales bacterium]|nr:bifunctional pyr operon transcriptional regulator/uracil phosphoribosyltransferase PyrR [Flavobacteriales bacterium]
MQPQVIVQKDLFALILKRLCHQLIENHNDFSESVLIGLQPRGIYLANRLNNLLSDITNNKNIQCGALDITFYRDDFRHRDVPLLPSATNIDFSIEGKNVVLIDDVLFTGRTVRAGFEALLAFGRPKKIEFLTLIDRRFTRQIPIQPDYVGKYIDTINKERVAVEWKETEGEDKVILLSEKKI